MGETRNLSKQIGYYFKGESDPKHFISFKGPLAFYKNINDGYITLEKAEEKLKEFKSDINEILKRIYKSQNQKAARKNIKTH